MRLIAGPPEAFRPGTVRLGRQGRHLLVHAILADDAPESRATADHQRMWELGDTFEIFLRDLAGSRYIELHITPSGHRLQLDFPENPIPLIHAGEARVEDFIVTPPLFDFLMRKATPGWEVLAVVPWPFANRLDGRAALVSFSRYDAQPEGAEPVLSSTSAHEKATFHRQGDWTPIVFGPPANP